MTSATGSCTVQYDQAGDANYNPATQVTNTVTAQKASQTISFDSLPDRKIGDPAFTLVATATSGLPVTFTVSGDCSIVVATVSLTKAGSCTVSAHQVGDSSYQPALDVDRSFVIAMAELHLPVIFKNAP